MLSFNVDKNVSHHINLYSNQNDNDDFSMIRLCKTAIEHKFNSISVDINQVENVWKWLEFSNVKLVGIINMLYKPLNTNDLFRVIKKTFESGADIVEVIMPLQFCDIDTENIPYIFKEYLNVISEAKAFNPIKITIETAYIPYISQINNLIDLISQYNIDYIKTSSSFYTKSSSINHLNLFLKKNMIKNYNIDFLFDYNSSYPLIINDAFRLAKNYNIPSIDNFIISCPIQFF